VEKDGEFLIVEERASGIIVLNQPGGHIEADESPQQAAEREALEKTGCEIRVNGLLDVYLWIHPQTRRNYLRIVYVSDLVSQDLHRSLDDGIYAVHWFTRGDLENRRSDIRTPIVVHCIDDYLAGKRKPNSLLDSLQPVQQNVQQVMANAHLI